MMMWWLSDYTQWLSKWTQWLSD